MTPQLLITLSPQGTLIAELPGANGMRRPVPIDSLASLSRILHAQLGRERVELGSDGAPTQRQVRHWEQHAKFRDPQCPFCRSENLSVQRQVARETIQLERTKRVIEIGDHGIERITRVPIQSRKLQAPSRGRQVAPEGAKLEDLGL